MPAAPVIAAVAAAVGTSYSIYSGERADKKQSQAQAQAEKQAKEQALQQAERDFNKANSKKANTAGLLQAAQQDGGGVSSTMLTGSDGIENDQLKLGKQNLLGKTSLLG